MNNVNYMEAWNTPGYFYTIGYFLCAVLIALHLPSGESKTRMAVRNLALGAILSLLMTISRGADGWVFVAYMVSVLLMIYGRMLLRTGEWSTAVFYGTKIFMMGELSASACWMVVYFLARWYPLAWNIIWQCVVMVLVYTLCGGLAYFAERRMTRRNMKLNIEPLQLATQMVVALSIYMISNIGYMDRAGMLGITQGREIFLTRTMVDLAGVALLYAQHSQMIEAQHRYEKEALRQVMASQYEVYQMSRDSMELVNQKYHDLKHQIHLLRREAGTEKSQEYLRQMEEEIRQYEAQNKTGNPVLDAVLTRKSLQCQREGIELRVIADGSLLGMMNEMEISALFGNMLDNAIESEEKAPPEKRIIRLYIDSDRGFARIRMENYTEENIRFSDGLPLTTKRDKNLHGFGMRSMRQTVEKYGGSLMADRQENWFRLRILIPLNAG